MNRSASAAIVAASNCVNQYTAASGSAILRVTTNPKVTAGLKCPPEMWPTAEAITAITSPCANATGSSWPPGEEARPDADEDERERADELGNRAAQPVDRHGARLRRASDGLC